MRSKILLPLAVLISLSDSQAASSKRGLVYIPNSKHKSDDQIWSSTYDLTWYYNYGLKPSSQLSSSKLQFVPMLWGAPKNPDTDTSFLDGVTKLVHDGTPIPHILSFNEPDGTTKTGGSNISPTVAATTWRTQIEPLRKYGIKVGSPAVTGSPAGMLWLQDFFTACNGGCNPDFMTVHWYGDFEGLASHLGHVSDTYSDVSELWVTEYALPHANLKDSETFYNQSAALLDRWENITHYSYFGAFRSDVSNIGPNASMLTQHGQLTNIGAWYLAESVTGAIPEGATGRLSTSSGWLWLLLATGAWSLL
ncbi:hypothetical protein FKW77_005056 [Venturia effusa]|uniref:Asl1-like glycosyl hydrolase catalytic domain-containing protein n=1 Tax=Venturia effusa TaxID=50376 RepID=A0A517LR79_9PEZI|nr:hypothetical protein FKW77_005056 [Venturia effusa]